jgi:uncharacterized protein YndB with AHSA1/START domain
MKSARPTGRVVHGPDGLDLVVTRTLPGSIDDAWASITEPERTARWIGRWDGDGVVGGTVTLRMGFEEDSPQAEVRILECEAPRRLRLLAGAGESAWDVAFDLAAVGGRCELRFVQRRVDPAKVGEVGPGWEYYLDQLLASMADEPLPSWDAYFPAQREHFQTQVQ